MKKKKKRIFKRKLRNTPSLSIECSIPSSSKCDTRSAKSNKRLGLCSSKINSFKVNVTPFSRDIGDYKMVEYCPSPIARQESTLSIYTVTAPKCNVKLDQSFGFNKINNESQNSGVSSTTHSSPQKSNIRQKEEL